MSDAMPLRRRRRIVRAARALALDCLLGHVVLDGDDFKSCAMGELAFRVDGKRSWQAGWNMRNELVHAGGEGVHIVEEALFNGASPAREQRAVFPLLGMADSLERAK